MFVLCLYYVRKKACYCTVPFALCCNLYLYYDEKLLTFCTMHKFFATHMTLYCVEIITPCRLYFVVLCSHCTMNA